MTVERGEVFGFLGPNGAGKTTTIRTLLDLLHPTSGAARLFGLDSRRDALAIHARLGNLPGDFAYDPRLTGLELVTYLAALRGSAASAAPPSWPSVSRPTSTVRSASCRAATGRRSASCRRRSTTPSCSSWTSRPAASTR